VENGLCLGLAPNVPAASAQRSGGAWLAQSGGPRNRAELMQATVEVRAALEDAVVAAAIAAQRACSLTAVLDEALAALAAADGDRAGSLTPASEVTGGADSLSPREREVLALVAEGRSNKAIAEALYVSPNTIKTHVASLFNKLHADTRAHLAVIATRHMVYEEAFTRA
jgi:DNA-binding NarL/FixJ family response regulator